MPFARAREVGNKLRKEASQDDISGLAAELTYRAFLALFPFVIFLAALGSVMVAVFDVDNPAQSFIDLFGDRLPADARSILTDQVSGVVEEQNVGLLSFGIFGALWAAMGGAAAVMKAMNRAYDLREGRPFYTQKALALVITLVGVLAVFVAVGVIFSTQVFQDQIAERLRMGGAFQLAVRIVSIPLVVIAIAAFTAMIYRVAPDARIPMRNCTPGAVLFAITWAVITGLFGIYVANFASYNATYGTLGGVVVLLFWFYLTNLLLLLGAEFNALSYGAVRDTTVSDMPQYEPDNQPAIITAAYNPAPAEVEVPLSPPNRGAVIFGLAAAFIATATFLKYSLFRCPRTHVEELRAIAPSPAE